MAYDFDMNDTWRKRQAEMEEQARQEKLEQQLKLKQMFKTITASVVGFILLVILFNSCERIDAGHVGVKVNQ